MIVEKSELTRVLTALQIPTKSTDTTQPIGFVWIKREEEADLKLETWSPTCSVRASIPAYGQGSLDVCVFLGSLAPVTYGDGEQVSFEVVDDKLHVSCGSFKTNLPTSDLQEYYPPVTDDYRLLFKASAPELLQTQTYFNKPIKNEIAGQIDKTLIKFHGINNEVRAVAVDNIHLAFCKITTAEEIDGDFDCILTPSMYEQAIRAHQKSQQVSVYTNGSVLQIADTDLSITVPLSTFTFKDYQMVLDIGDLATFQVTRLALIKAAKLIHGTSGANSEIVFSHDGTHLKGRTYPGSEDLNHARAEFSIECTSSPFELVIKTLDLLEALVASSGETISIKVLENLIGIQLIDARNWCQLFTSINTQD